MESPSILKRIGRALIRTRFGIKTVAIVYAIGLFAGALMVHANSGFALRLRDGLVGGARRSSPILGQGQKGHHLTAASLDAGGNAAAGLLSMIAGYGVPAGYWVAGTEAGWAVWCPWTTLTIAG